MPLFTPHLPDLEVNTTVNSNVLDVGEHAYSSTTIQNNGPDPARNLNVEKPLANLVLRTYNRRWEFFQNGIWFIPFLAAGANATLAFTGDKPIIWPTTP